MKNKQTAVDWLEDKIATYDFSQGMAQMRKYILQAKQMEKEQIKDAYTDGCIGELYELNAYYTSEKYYNETYKQQENDN